MRSAIASEFDIERRLLTGSDAGQGAGEVRDENSRVGRFDRHVDRDVRDRVLNRAHDAVGDARPEAGRNLEVERIAGRDRIRGAVRDRVGRIVGRAGQSRDRRQVSSRVCPQIGVRSQADHKCSERVEAGDRFLNAGSVVKRCRRARRVRDVRHGDRHAVESDD